MAGAALLILAGLWLLMQTIAGDLPRRIITWGGAAAAGGSTSGGWSGIGGGTWAPGSNTPAEGE